MGGSTGFPLLSVARLVTLAGTKRSHPLAEPGVAQRVSTCLSTFRFPYMSAQCDLRASCVYPGISSLFSLACSARLSTAAFCGFCDHLSIHS
mmetsp:Transcript_27199/g.63388  ORF Transcript_27199/g.63388 Transcript_27199/m.63388 type:complete len:92 (-) Transcript_27199:104-379(-)